MTNTNDKPVVHFVVLQSVEDYVEKSGKFRTECASFKIPGRDSGGANTIYIPYCEKQRFDFGPELNDYRGHGVFKPPEMGKPWEIPDFNLFVAGFHDIHCPEPCRGYSDKRSVAPENSAPQVSKKHTPGSTEAGKWTKKDVIVAVVVPLVVALVGGLFGWLTPEGRLLLHLDKPQEQHAPNLSAPHTNSSPPQSKPEQITAVPTNRANKQKARPQTPESQEPKPPIVSAPNGIAIGGGTVINPTVNNFGPTAPTPTFELLDKQPLPESAAPQLWIRIAIDRTFLDPKFAIVCDRPCKVLRADMVLGPGGGFQQVSWGKIPDHENIAAVSVNQPNPMPSEDKVETVVASEDDKPFKILAVRRLTIAPTKQ